MIRSALQALRAGHVFDGLDTHGRAIAPPEREHLTDSGPDGRRLPGLIDASPQKASAPTNLTASLCTS